MREVEKDGTETYESVRCGTVERRPHYKANFTFSKSVELHLRMSARSAHMNTAPKRRPHSKPNFMFSYIFFLHKISDPSDSIETA